MSNSPENQSSTTVLTTGSTEPVVGKSIPYERFMDCVHCGLCLNACPTYVETGNENDSPRGRIYLMRSVVDGRLDLTDRVRRHLDLCLDCRSCETACPSGVQYGRMLEPFRVEMHQHSSAGVTDGSGNLSDSSAARNPDWFERWILHGLFPYPGRMAAALLPARWMQKLGLDRMASATGLTRLLPQKLQRMQQQLPKLKAVQPALPDFLPAKGKKRATVALFVGCVADAMFRHVHWATARVLQQNGCDVLIPKEQACCGAIHYHSGAAGPAQQLMQQNIAAFRDSRIDAVIVNVAGCGAMLKDYAHISEELNHGTAAGSHSPPTVHGPPGNQSGALSRKSSPSPEEAFCGRVQDIAEFLMKLGPVRPQGRIDAVVAYQDACHLQHAQKIRQQPRDLLALIPGITIKAIAEPELCCGAAGSYNLTEPEMADRLGNRKVGHILDVTPDLIVTGNAGCSLQLQAKLKERKSRVPVVHPMELLDLSYRNGKLKDLV